MTDINEYCIQEEGLDFKFNLTENKIYFIVNGHIRFLCGWDCEGKTIHWMRLTHIDNETLNDDNEYLEMFSPLIKNRMNKFINLLSFV